MISKNSAMQLEFVGKSMMNNGYRQRKMCNQVSSFSLVFYEDNFCKCKRYGSSREKKLGERFMLKRIPEPNRDPGNEIKRSPKPAGR